MIKKILSAAVICFAGFTAMAQSPVTISGMYQVEKGLAQPVKLFKVDAGVCQQIATATPDADGKFGFLFYPGYEGLYVIGTGNELSPNGNYKFYLKGGDKLSLTIEARDYKLTGNDNSKENQELYAWHQLTDKIYQKAINFMGINSTYVDFFPDLEATAAKVKTWLNGKRTGNPKFDAAMPGIMQMDMAMYATNFLNTPRSAHPSVEEYSPYYATLKAENVTKTTNIVYSYPWGLRTVDGLASVDYRKSSKTGYGKDFDMVKEFGAFIPNDTLKGDILLNKLKNLKDYGQYKSEIEKYGQYILTDKQKKASADKRAELATLAKGGDAFQFSFVDNHGQNKTMNDFKGKVILVDVWATWCGPCKAEIPYLKKLEEEMKGKDVQFVSISVDEAKDKDKWLHFIDTAKLGGTQLFAGGWSQASGSMAQYYKISGIPRFMVFDRVGKIVTVDSPRPSDPKLKTLLEATLAE